MSWVKGFFLLGINALAVGTWFLVVLLQGYHHWTLLILLFTLPSIYFLLTTKENMPDVESFYVVKNLTGIVVLIFIGPLFGFWPVESALATSSFTLLVIALYCFSFAIQLRNKE